MKQQLTEALARLELPEFAIRPGNAHFQVFIAAARLVERLLPGECPNPMHGRPFSPNAIDVPDHCPDCVDGRVWDEGIVEAVAKALFANASTPGFVWLRPSAVPEAMFMEQARIALSALVELLEKVEK